MSEQSPTFVPLPGYQAYPEDEMRARALRFREELQRRRSVRDFSNRPVPRNVIEECLLAAGAAPSGANLQPWHFVVVSSPEVRGRIREAAEREEHEFYARASKDWLEALAPLGTGPEKRYLEEAPCLIAVFARTYEALPDGSRVRHFYAAESVGIATGVLITALHHAGLAVLPHTPSPAGTLNEILGRPNNERPFLLLVVGYPAEGARVPVLPKKSLSEIMSFIE